MHPLQEKFQICVPTKEEAGEGWVFPGVDNRQSASQRYFGPMDANNSYTLPVDEVNELKFNQLPPGMEINNQKRVQIQNMPLVLAGESDVSKDTNAQALADGFTKRKMKGCDDQYTGEHVDHFYGDAGGFVERNNYLDRE